MPESSTTVEKDSPRDSLLDAAAVIERASEAAEAAAEAARSAEEAAEAAGVDDWPLDLEEAAEDLQAAADLLMALTLELEALEPDQHPALSNAAHGRHLPTLSNAAHGSHLPAPPPTRRKRPQRLPPYARRIVDARRRGERMDRILIATGADAWKQAAAAADPLAILPDGEDVQAFVWTFVRGLPCQIVQTAPCSAARMDQLAVALVQAGSPRVELLSPGGDDADLYLPREAP